MQEIQWMIQIAMKAVSIIIYLLFAVSSIKEKKSGNYLEAIYRLGWAIIFYMSCLYL